MPRTVAGIPVNAPIVNKDGTITTFFRLRWQSLIDGSAESSTIAHFNAEGQSAAVVTATLFTVVVSGRYRVTWYLRKRVPDGAGSSAQVTIGWSDHGQALLFTGANLVLDTAAAYQSSTLMLRSDASVDITIAVAYTSTVPGTMSYDIEVIVEYLP